MSRRVLSMITIVGATCALFASPVAADPQNRNSFGPVVVDCGAVGTFSVVVHGNGSFAAAQDLDSNRVLVPNAFGEAVFTYTAPDGTVSPPEFEQANSKGSGKQGGVWCSYSFDIDTGNGLENLSGSGSVRGRITPGA